MIYAIVTVLVLIADQAVKLWTTQNIALGAVGEECVPLIPGFVHATNLHNYGAAFGIMQDARWPLAIVSALFAVVIIVLINKEVIHTRFGRWLAVLIVAGALGNCIDRLLYGYVVDMFEFEFLLFGRPFSFPVFNVADIFITTCGILFCIHLIFYKEPEAVRAANEPEFMRRRRAEQRPARQERARRPVYEEEPLDAWDFGDDRPSPPVRTVPAERPAPARSAPETRKAAPRRVENRPPAYEPEMPARRGRAAAPAPEERRRPAPEPDVYDDIEQDTEEFSLEDILSEFRDL